MGCSIGGRAVLHLALRHGDHFRAAIGLQSATHAEAGADTRLRDLGVLFRPDVHGQEAAAGTVACLISPTSPAAEKWETLWHYMQGGPAVFMGDLHYYFTDGDLRNAPLASLDPAKCPLYLLTGEYDLSATPQLTAELARLVKARHFEVMQGLGHFPMSESPLAVPPLSAACARAHRYGRGGLTPRGSRSSRTRPSGKMVTLLGTPCGRVGTASRLSSAFHEPSFCGVMRCTR